MARACYWKQTRYNEYRLFDGVQVEVFDCYEKLYAYCQRNGLDAKQV